MNAFTDLFTTQEQSFGLPSGYLARTAEIESGFNPNAKNPNSSAGGLFQFIDSTAKQYGLQDRFDPRQATEAAARLAADNARILERGLGRAPTAGELYLAHQQGAGGALKLLRNPDARAEDVVGSAAARLNRGGGRTAGDFASMWTGKFDNAPTRVSNFPDLPNAPMPPPREEMMMARGGNPMDGGLLAYASLGGAPQQAPAQQPMAFAQGGNGGGMQPQPARMERGPDGLPTAMQGIQASFGGGTPFAPQADMPAVGAREAVGLLDTMLASRPGGSVDDQIAEFGMGGTRSRDEQGRTLAEARGIMSADTEGAAARGREAASISAGDFNNRFGDEPSPISADAFNDRFEGEPVGLLNIGGTASAPDSRGLFGPDPFAAADRTIDAVQGGTRGGSPNIDAMMTPQEPGGFSPPMRAGPAAYASPPPLDAPQDIPNMPQPNQAPMPQPRMQPQGAQQPVDPNAYAGGDWIPPDVGMQLAQAQMRGGNMPNPDAPAQDAAAAQGTIPVPGGAPMAIDPAQAQELPAPPADISGRVAPVAQPQAAAQPATQAASGEPSPMRQMFADMLGAVGQSLMETGDLRGMGRAMQAMQLASSNRRKSAQEQRAIVSILRQSGMPEDMAIEMSVTPALAQMGLSTFMATREQDAAQQFNERANSVFNGGVGTSAPPASGAPVDAQQPATSADGAQPAPQRNPNQSRLEGLYQQQRELAVLSTDPANGARAKGLLDQTNREIERMEKAMGGGFRQATLEEAAGYGAPAGQFGPDGRFYPINPPTGMTIESDGQGGFRMVQGAGVTPGGGGNVNENLNAGFVLRGRDSHAVISDLEEQGTIFKNKIAESLPGGVGNFIVTPEAQKYDQAKRDFINATLRRESGAVIADSEFANAEIQYFPQPGDSPEVIELKRANRANVVRAMEMSAGKAVPPRGEEPAASAPDDAGWTEIDGVQIRRKAQ